MLERVGELDGVSLSLAAYVNDFAEHEAKAATTWKLERQQDFVETDLPSWDAAAAGDWHTAMRLARDDLRPMVRDQLGPRNERGMVSRRLRIAATPLSTYLRWELPALLIRAEYGEQIRVGPPELVRVYETTAELPEIVGMDDTVMYHILYDDRGALAGGRRITDPEAIAACHHEFDELWAGGRELGEYVRSDVAALVPFLP